MVPREVKLDETHKLWKERTCHTFDDSNVLIEGMPQAQLLTKTLYINDLPNNLKQDVKQIKISAQTDIALKNAILSSHVFDAQQEKTAIRKDPNRPAFVLPRIYGITDSRKKYINF